MLHCFYVLYHSDLQRHPSRDSSPTSAMGFSPSPTPSGPVSVFKALYSYDPGQMSPNPQPSSELALQEGQVLLVFGNMGEVSGYHWAGAGHHWAGAGHHWAGRGTTGLGWGTTGLGGAVGQYIKSICMCVFLLCMVRASV